MLVDFEILIVFTASLFFTVLTFLVGDRDSIKLLFNVLSAVCWFVLGLGFMGAGPNFPVFALLFLIFGVVFSVRTIIASTSMLKARRETWR